MNCRDLMKKSEEYRLLKDEWENADREYSDFKRTQEQEVEVYFASLSNTIQRFCGSLSFRSVIRNLCYLYAGILSVTGGNLAYRGCVPAPIPVNGNTAHTLAQRCIGDIKYATQSLAARNGNADDEIKRLCVCFVTLRSINARIPALREQALRTALDAKQQRIREIEQKIGELVRVYPELAHPGKVEDLIADQKKNWQRQNDRFCFKSISVADRYDTPISLPLARNAVDGLESDIFCWNPTEDGILYVRIPSGRYEIASDFIIGLAMQFLYAYPLMNKQILYCCQNSLSQMDNFLMVLKDVCKDSVFFNGIEQLEANNFYHEIGECLKDLRNEVKRRSNLMEAVAAESIYEYNVTEGADRLSPILVFLHDYPTGFSGCKDLGYFFRECARYGMFFVVLQTQFDDRDMVGDICDPSRYRGIDCELTEDGRVSIDGCLRESVCADKASIRPLLQQLVMYAEKRKTRSYLSYEDIGFGKLDSNADGYCTKISIPVGKVNNKPFSLDFATSTSEEDQRNRVKTPLAYLIVGSPKSGKSTLIDSLVINGSMAYSPDDLIFYLLDFKDGVTASFYDGENAIPHVRMIASHNKEEDTDIILSGLLAEKERRNGLLKSCNTADIAGYNSVSGEKLPRIIVIVDECQNLFASEPLAEKCEKLAREGRSAGIHLVLASQDAKHNMMQHAGKFMDGRFCFFMSNKSDAEQVISSSYTKALHVDVPSGSGLAYMSLESGENCERIQVAFHGGDGSGKKLDYNRQIREKWAKHGYGIHLIKAGENSPLTLDGFSADENPLIAKLPMCAGIGENYFDHSIFHIDFEKISSRSMLLLGEREKPFSDILTSVMTGAIACGARIKLIDESVERPLFKLFGTHPRVMSYTKEQYMTALGEVYEEFERRKQNFREKYEPYFFIIHSLYRLEDYAADKRLKQFTADVNADIRSVYAQIQSSSAVQRNISGKMTLLTMLSEAAGAPDFHIIITTNSIDDSEYTEKNVFSKCGCKILQNQVSPAAYMLMEHSFKAAMISGLNENIVFVSEKGSYSKCRYFQYDMNNENTRKLLGAAWKRKRES